MRVKFGGVKYRIKWRKLKGRTLGRASSPEGKKPRLEFHRKIRGKKYELLVLLHEAMHALNWKFSEKKIHRDSSEMARFLKKMGVVVTRKGAGG